MAAVGNPNIAEAGKSTRFGQPGGNTPMTPAATRRLVASNRARAVQANAKLIGAVELLIDDAQNLTPNENDAPITHEERYDKKVQSAKHILSHLNMPFVKALIEAKETADEMIPLGAPDNPEATTDEKLAMRVMYALARGLDAAKREREAVDITAEDE